MSLVVGYDPGICCPGVAFFRDGVYVASSLCRLPARHSVSTRLRMTMLWLTKLIEDYTDTDITLVTERPQVYRRDGNKAGSLIKTAMSLGVFAAAWSEHAGMIQAHDHTPREWKGNVPKTAMCDRILKRLASRETKKYNQDMRGFAPSLHNNAIDAIGICLYQLGRL